MARRFLTGLGSSYVALIINALMMIVLMPFFLKHLGEEMTGVYIMIASLSNILNFGIGWIAEASGVTISSRSHAHRTSHLVKPIYRLQQLIFSGYGLLICFLLCLSALVLPHFWQPQHPEHLRDVQFSLALFGAHYLIFLLHNGDLAFLTAQLRVDLTNACKAIYSIVFCLLTILLLQLKAEISMIFIAQLATTIILGITSQLYLRKYRINWLQAMHSPRRLLWRAVLVRVGGPIATLAVLWGIMMYIDTALVGFLLGPAAAAHYFAGTKIADMFALLLIRISETALPYFARLKNSDGDRQFFYLQFQRAVLFLCIIAAAGYGLFGDAIMKLWLGENAPLLPPVLFWLAGAGILIRTMVKYEYNVIIAIQAAEKILPVSFLETALRVVVMVICVHFFGLVGVILSLVLVYAGGVYWLIKHQSMRTIGVSLRDNFMQSMNPLALSALSIAIWWALDRLLWPQGAAGYMAVISAALMGAIAVAVPVLLMRQFPLIHYGKLSRILQGMAHASKLGK